MASFSSTSALSMRLDGEPLVVSQPRLPHTAAHQHSQAGNRQSTWAECAAPEGGGAASACLSVSRRAGLRSGCPRCCASVQCCCVVWRVVRQLLHSVPRADRLSHDRPVGRVADPPGHSQPLRLVARALPEAHSLHAPEHLSTAQRHSGSRGNRAAAGSVAALAATHTQPLSRPVERGADGS